MTPLWPWLAVAGLGALHGLSPANGWLFVAACGVRAREGAPAWRALLPIAIGHATSVALVACAVTQGLTLERTHLHRLAGVLLIAVASYRSLGGAAPHTPMNARARRAGLALWSFLMATAHGAGLMLVPAFVPLCLADNPARAITASGSLALAAAAVVVHAAAMLATTGIVARGVVRGIARYPRLLNGAAPRRAGTAALAVTGVLLLALR